MVEYAPSLDRTLDRTKAGREAQVEENGALVEALRDQVTYLKEQLDIRNEELREHRRLLAGLIERVPELEATAGELASSQGHDDGAVGPSRNGEGVGAPVDQEHQNGSGGVREPWYNRWFA